jgi:hypothetical protein
LPQGKFNNSSLAFIREWILKKARLLAVVGLHPNTFKPHTGTKTSVLFVQKHTQDQIEQITKVHDQVAGACPDYELEIRSLLKTHQTAVDVPEEEIRIRAGEAVCRQRFKIEIGHRIIFRLRRVRVEPPPTSRLILYETRLVVDGFVASGFNLSDMDSGLLATRGAVLQVMVDEVWVPKLAPYIHAIYKVNGAGEPAALGSSVLLRRGRRLYLVNRVIRDHCTAKLGAAAPSEASFETRYEGKTHCEFVPHVDAPISTKSCWWVSMYSPLIAPICNKPAP